MGTDKKYFIVGIRPVYMEKDSKGKVINSFMFSWETGEFIKDDQYWLKIIFSRIDEIDELNESDFLIM